MGMIRRLAEKSKKMPVKAGLRYYPFRYTNLREKKFK